jgi:hypothetical protein
MRRKKTPVPATQDELNAIQDSYRDARAPLIDAYFEARRVGDNDACYRLWELTKSLMAQERDALTDARQGISA